MSGQHQFGLSRGVVNVKRCRRPAPPICGTGHVLWRDSNNFCAGSRHSEVFAAENLTLVGSPGPVWSNLLDQSALNPRNRVTYDAKSGLTGKGPLAECVMSHFSASQFLAMGWAETILKTSCEDVLLTQVEIRRCNDQTLALQKVA